MTGSSPDTFESRSGTHMAARCSRSTWSSGWYIAATVTAFIFFWPLGLAMLGIGYAAIAWLLKFVASNSLRPFIYYRLVLGAILLIALGTGVMKHN